jgi:MraZ protein
VEPNNLRHLVLYGEHELSIDDKNRMLIPSDIRKQLDPERDGEAFFVVWGVDGRVWLYPERYYEQKISQDFAQLTPDEDSLDYDRWNLGMIGKIEWDKQGRVLIPDKFVKRSGLGKEVTLVGVRDHLELWTRADWEVKREALAARQAQVALKRRMERLTPPQS